MSCKDLYGGYISRRFIEIVYLNRVVLANSVDEIANEMALLFWDINDAGLLVIDRIIELISSEEAFYQKKRNDTRYGFIVFECILQFLRFTNSVSPEAKKKLLCLLHDQFFYEYERMRVVPSDFSEFFEVGDDDFDLIKFIKHHLSVFNIDIKNLNSYKLIANEFFKLIVALEEVLAGIQYEVHQYILLQFLYEVDFKRLKFLMQYGSYIGVQLYVRSVFRNLILSACRLHCDFFIKSSDLLPFMFNIFSVKDCVRMYLHLTNSASLGLVPSLKRIFSLGKAFLLKKQLLMRNRKVVRAYRLSFKDVSLIYSSDVYVLEFFKELLRKRKTRRILINYIRYFGKIYKASRVSKYTVHGIHNEYEFEGFNCPVFRFFMERLFNDAKFFRKVDKKYDSLYVLNIRLISLYKKLFSRFQRMPVVKEKIKDLNLMDKCLRFNLSTVCYHYVLFSKGSLCRKKKKKYEFIILFFYLLININMGNIEIWSEELKDFYKLLHYHEDYVDKVISMFKIRYYE